MWITIAILFRMAGRVKAFLQGPTIVLTLWRPPTLASSTLLAKTPVVFFNHPGAIANVVLLVFISPVVRYDKTSPPNFLNGVPIPFGTSGPIQPRQRSFSLVTKCTAGLGDQLNPMAPGHSRLLRLPRSPTLEFGIQALCSEPTDFSLSCQRVCRKSGSARGL